MNWPIHKMIIQNLQLSQSSKNMLIYLRNLKHMEMWNGSIGNHYCYLNFFPLSTAVHKIDQCTFSHLFLKNSFQILVNSALSISIPIPDYAIKLQNFKGNCHLFSKFDSFNYLTQNRHFEIDENKEKLKFNW